ncbi:hypothetical protein HDU99_006386, partial [Rhizoclosmatium hyalinum]
VCDDDHIYGSTVLRDLYNHYRNDPSKAYGLRGWRINADMTWGVTENFWHHIIHGHFISTPYRVGILTANSCYILNSSCGAKLMDDIWINGHLAKLGVQRYLVPAWAVSVDFAKTKFLEGTLKDARIDREKANNEAIEHFRAAFVREKIPYIPLEQDVNGVNSPEWAFKCNAFNEDTSSQIKHAADVLKTSLDIRGVLLPQSRNNLKYELALDSSKQKDSIDHCHCTSVTVARGTAQMSPQIIHRSKPPDQILISLTSTAARLAYELPLTISSLLTQNPLPSPVTIHIYIPYTDQQAFAEFLTTHPKSALHHPRVTIIPSFDYGPATKFIPAILDTDHRGPIIVCDDDHIYGLTVFRDLYNHYRKDPSKAYGLRGWRINADMTWGVTKNFWHHIIHGHLISTPYRVGILTANSCYILNSAWFAGNRIVISDYTGIKSGAKLMDDIWINGHLAQLGVQRYLIPTWTVSVDFAKTKSLEGTLKDASIDRQKANNEAIEHFRAAFVREKIPYIPLEQDVNRVNSPEWAFVGWRKGWVPFREWLVRGDGAVQRSRVLESKTQEFEVSAAVKRCYQPLSSCQSSQHQKHAEDEGHEGTHDSIQTNYRHKKVVCVMQNLASKRFHPTQPPDSPRLKPLLKQQHFQKALPDGELNPGRRRERAESWPLDDLGTYLNHHGNIELLRTLMPQTNPVVLSQDCRHHVTL